MLKQIRILTLIITCILGSVNKAEAGNLMVADHRYTAGAQASDYAQCSSLYGVYVTAKVATKIGCLSGCIAAMSWAASPAVAAAVCPKTCILTATAAGMAAFYGVYEGYSSWAEDIRKHTKVINTIDPAKPQCSDVSNLNNASNFVGDGESYQGWDKTGPLGNYCYHEKFNHHLKINKEIYNGGEGKIGISYMGEEPVFIGPEDCKTIATNGFESMIGGKRIFCAWQQGDEICAEAVFCSSLLIGDVFPVSGAVGDPDRATSKARRACGVNPYDLTQIDDFITNKRCECFCCEGSKDHAGCANFATSQRSCKTYNEKFNAHCVKTPIVEEEFDSPIAMPNVVSAHCSMDVNSGYAAFSFVGKAVRCFEKTLSNMYFGKEDIVERDAEGKKIVDPMTGGVEFRTQCIDNLTTDDGGCKKALYKEIQNNVSNIVFIILTFWAFFLGVQFLMGGFPSMGEMFMVFVKFGLVIYFAVGDGWKEGYYNFLMNSSFEVSQEFFKVSKRVADDDKTLSLMTDPSKITFEGDMADQVASCSFTNMSVANESGWEKINQCNFFDGISPAGNPYKDGEAHYGVLDAIDCKFSRYMGFDINNYFPELIKVAAAMIFATPSGIFFFAAAMYFIVASLIFLLEITFTLVVTIMMINFLIYLSPIIIPLVMITRTKKIFDNWLKALLGYSLQPLILFALISLIIVLIDGFFVTYVQSFYSDLAIEYREEALGVSVPRVGANFDPVVLVENMLIFAFLMVVIQSMYRNSAAIISSLSGADSATNMIGMPKFEQGIKKGIGKAKEYAKNAGSYAYDKARGGISAGRDAAGEVSEKAANEKKSKGGRGSKTPNVQISPKSGGDKK